MLTRPEAHLHREATYLGVNHPYYLSARSSGRATAFITSSQILLSRGVAGLDPEQTECSEPTSTAPLITILENAFVHILYVGPSSEPDVTRLAGDRLTRFGMGPLELDSSREPEASATSNDSDEPIRPKASPRLSPTISTRSSFSFRVASEHSDSATPSSEEGSPIRGRTLARVPKHEHSEPLAKTRLKADFNFGDLGNFTMRQRFLSRDLSDEPEDIDGRYMEPLPLEYLRSSLSEELHKAATFNGSIDMTRFGGHRDTFAILGLRRMQIRGPELPATFFQRLLDYIGFEAYLALRLSCRYWSAGITTARPVVMPPVCRLPVEILEKVYAYLSPVDLNAARHTCRSWMISSLEERLLTRVLKEGGWWRAAKADMDLHEELNGHRTVDSITEEWLLSKRLATECSLRPEWTGNGLSRQLSSFSAKQLNHNAVALTCETDFSELSTGYNSSCVEFPHGSAVHFTVSICGKFLLVTEGCLIYIYSLRESSSTTQPHGAHLSPVTSVICPHRVLAVSMDTSAQRFAVAALLEGRVGLVCDLHENIPSCSRRRSTPQVFSAITRDCRTSIYSSVSSSEPIFTEATSLHGHATFSPSSNDRADRALAQAIAEASHPEVHGAREVRTSWRMDDPLVSPEPGASRGFSTKTGYIPLETGVHSIYHNLCSADDPPRSVSIYPQRRCVAFGCSAGIELHWIDALTGQDLNRWFPLTAPSDFLYFLPPRPGVDSAKKLRLISSACHPKVKGGLGGRFFPCTSTSAARDQGMTWDEGLYDPSTRDYAWEGSGWRDHYRAVPISDGWNVLFTDPVEGNVCLGADAPPGFGVTKLIRRFIFVGPSELGDAGVPKVYAAGGELRWGVRVVVGYGEKVWLFVVPPDTFFGHQDRTAERQDGQDAHAVDEPIRIEGVEIGDVQGLVDLAVDASGGDLTIRAFAVNGMAYVWQIAGQRRSLELRIVLNDGTVRALQDANGDTYMFNTSREAVQFDGAAPLRPAYTGAMYSQPSLRLSIDNLLVGLHDHVIDHDGDVNMPDVDAMQDEGYASGDEGFAQAGGAFAIHAPPLWGRWSEEDADWVPDYLAQVGGEIEDEGLGMDVLELTRLEVEVLCG